MKYQEKKSKINSLSKEVKEFHPVLEQLFKNMDKIQNVDYTHGSNELGADFVLTSLDDILCETEYIGVIVKTGNINQSRINGIDKQIRECNIDRFAINGKKQISLNVIWVITNEGFTSNAEKIINNKFKTKNIKFIRDSSIIKLIDKHIQDYWMDIDIEVSDLINKVNLQIQDIDRSLSLVTIENNSFYIEQEILKQYENEYNTENTKRKKLIINKEIEDNNFLLIEGGMGAGKSKLLRKVCLDYSSIDNYVKFERIPVFVSYVDFYDKFNSSIDDTITSFLNTYQHKELLDNNFVILIDGFDEKLSEKDKLTELNKISEQASEKRKIILTTRFLSGFIEKESEICSCERYEIAPLSLKKTIEFLEKICKSINISQRIFEDLKKSTLLKELPRSPIAAILLAKLLQENTKDLPANMTELYSKYLELMLGRWDIDKDLDLETQKEYQISETVISNIAEHFIDENVVSISDSECFSYFDDYLSERNTEISSKQLYDKVIKRSNILSKNNITNEIMFSHRTFAEYYYAKSKNKENSLVINDKAFDLYWMNICFFYIGLKQDCPELLQDIVSIDPKNESQAWLKLINMSNYFLAGYSTPYIIVEDNLFKLMIYAAKLYLDIIRKKIDSPFGFLSEISLLWWIQYILRESYSYEYFEKALDATILKIEESSEEQDTKLYALFFSSLVFLELGNSDSFEYLISNHKTDLPLNLQFGFYYEGDKLKDTSKIIKKQVKRIHRRLSNLPNKDIESLHKNAISLKKIT
ncbi:MAG: hypothetical protein HN921_17985 [Bacteroidetes bacterium]|jgi:hypothetical protein|nr:hypothetical protein [Candidatus Cloacimonadota bacterium]MBT7041726.1 hypothetical protein [Bacteroidota bacterium]